jgi:hypothetical protein
VSLYWARVCKQKNKNKKLRKSLIFRVMINCFWEGKYMQVRGLMKIKKTLIDKGLLKHYRRHQSTD